ncbi:cation diffusion facilitator family transporter [Legionella jamestowniensis]|uniref:Cation efflux system protein n=1 Tax=Legionella jamestowniensis TaxID=455 RepID=A0A0W0UYZ3_9GAMM|nr:cation diffusion facilitator family transporter [Legionella jamestowniensis]KTD13047.1 cation efflux system protein [Legionella jamestowniensis]SFL79973.1 cobalt-zinc-cadmium efflux system protein [Legionella jamestowniensis DSM 19215]
MIFHQHDNEGHDHSHNHNHGHVHVVSEFNSAFIIAIIANGLFVVCQIIFAYLANSTSLLADAVHNLGDVLSLILAWIANGLLKRLPTNRTTYGMKKTSILAALANGVLLVFTCGIIATEAMYKLFSPTEIHAVSVIIVASIGILVNGATAVLFLRGTDDLNIRGAFLHLLYDALISVGVVISAVILYFTNWLWIDPVVGLLIAILIIKGTWSLFTDSFHLIIDAVPRGISWMDVRDSLQAEPGVKEVHDLHIWALSTKENAMSVHLYMPDAPLSDEARQVLVKMLHDKHQIHHATIQVERNLSFCEDACKPILN